MTGALLVALAALWVTGEATSEGHLARECNGVEACRRMEAEVHARAAACWLLCGQAQAEHRTARVMLHRAVEREAVREHYLERDRVERLHEQADQQRRADAVRQAQAERAREAERAHQQAVELASIKQQAIERRIALERQRLLRYLTALGAEGRRARLERCHQSTRSCQELAVDLIEATESQDEARELAQLNEVLIAGGGVPHAEESGLLSLASHP